MIWCRWKCISPYFLLELFIFLWSVFSSVFCIHMVIVHESLPEDHLIFLVQACWNRILSANDSLSGTHPDFLEEPFLSRQPGEMNRILRKSRVRVRRSQIVQSFYFLIWYPFFFLVVYTRVFSSNFSRFLSLRIFFPLLQFSMHTYLIYRILSLSVSSFLLSLKVCIHVFTWLWEASWILSVAYSTGSI